MSDAIRCGQCRWWNQIAGGHLGVCEYAPAIYVCEDYWQQPLMHDYEGCSRGKPKSGSTITVKLTEEKT